ncbi:MAG: hypothetical protein M1831_006947 [Alyxoria varia]|nr:MAG: hypothetical protein M1831_006947 [Alyxoria varia]
MSQSQETQLEDSHEITEDITLHVVSEETPASVEDVFVPPSVHRQEVLEGRSYTHYSPIPSNIVPHSDQNGVSTSSLDRESSTTPTPCVLGIDEAGRGPVIGPMVYSAFYVPQDLETSLLSSSAHKFSDSKALTPVTRSMLMRQLCTSASSPSPTLHSSCGWSTYVLSARSISAGMLSTGAAYNLNAQAMDATIALIQGVIDRGVDVREIYVDTVGRPDTYQDKLQRRFPSARVIVEKKADSLYPCVSAASVCAKVTRDAALNVEWELSYGSSGIESTSIALQSADEDTTMKEGNDGNQVNSTQESTSSRQPGWGSGYPSDARCTAWLKQNMDPVFGWGGECRFSWGTAKELLEATRSAPCTVNWPVLPDEDGDDDMRLTNFFTSMPATNEGAEEGAGDGGREDIASWFGTPVTGEVF